MQQPMPNLEDITDPTTAINMTLVLMAKAFKLNYSTPTNNNQRISSNPRNKKIAQPVQNVTNQVVQNAVQNPSIQNVRNQNWLIVFSGIANQNPNGNGHLARNYTVRPRRRDADLDGIEKVNANYILMVNLQQASTSGTQTNKTLVYDSNGSAKLLKEKSTVSSLQEEKKKLKSDFKIQAAKFVRDFQSLAKEADESLAKHKALEWEIERLLRAVVSHDIVILYDKAYNDMKQKIERLQAQLGDQKGKSKDTPCVSDALDPLPQKLENENVKLEFQ
ncbi:hypothetical protein Tco_0514210, partial [Tanacetum coccineum]